MDEIAWAAYQKRLKELEEIKQTITELYGTYDAGSVLRARRDGLISFEEKMDLKRNCPYN